MARSLRIDYPDAWHHVMNRGARRQAIFLDDVDRQIFVGLLAQVTRRFGIRINAFCQMKNHYHLLVQTPQGQLSESLQFLDGQFARRFNARHHVDGPLFKGRFLSKVIETDAYLRTVLTYVHRNPLEANVIEDLEKYEWSSYPSLLSPDLAPEWLHRDAVHLAGLGTPRDLRLATAQPLTEDERSVIERSVAAVGSPTFVADVLQLPPAHPTTDSHRKATGQQLPLDRLEAAIDRHLFEGGFASWPPSARATRLRWIRVGLAQELCGLSLVDAAARYGYGSANSAGSAASRFRDQMKQTDFQAEVRRILHTANAFG